MLFFLLGRLFLWSLGPFFPLAGTCPLRLYYYFAVLRRSRPTMAYPANYRYTREHEWISVEGTIGSIGITDYAQNSLGDIVYVDAPKIGDTVTANATFGSVESVKAVSDLYSPVSGTVTAVNEALKTEPDKINQDAHSTWIIKVELSNPGEVAGLLD